MSDGLSSSAQKVQRTLETLGVDCQVVELPGSTRTAKEAAQAIGCEVAQIVKSILFCTRETRRPVLVVASGINRVNEKLIAGLVGEAIEKADADFVRERTGFVIGGVPPVGHAEAILTYVDRDLLQYPEIWAAAGTPHAVFCLTPQDLTRISAGEVVSIV